jgi:hypothetical protein
MKQGLWNSRFRDNFLRLKVYLATFGLVISLTSCGVSGDKLERYCTLVASQVSVSIDTASLTSNQITNLESAVTSDYVKDSILESHRNSILDALRRYREYPSKSTYVTLIDALTDFYDRCYVLLGNN